MCKIPNQQQRQVIDEVDNNVILYAGAGTGKTFTVANRVANILMQEKAKAEEILCLTFTIKACNEMKEDVLGYAGEIAQNVQISTIHGFCYRLIVEELKRVGEENANYTICDEIDQEEILKSILSSRFYAWVAEKNCQEENLLFPNLENCEIVKIGEEYYWNFDNYFLSTHGQLQKMTGEIKFTSLEGYCAQCQSVQPLRNKQCSACGQEFSLSFSRKEFEIFDKKIALRNMISAIKHQREEDKLYTGDEIADNQSAFESLRKKKPTLFEGLFSHYARYHGYLLDEDFLLAMEQFAGKFVAEYDEYLRLSGLLDFDDLIIKANRILESKDGAAYWDNRFKYIILDEMQDTSSLEYDVLRKIFAKNNVMLCGDFFQTIYGWRGSQPEKILGEYVQEFDAKPYTLSANYRATKTLAQAAFGYLKNTYPKLIGRYCPNDLEIFTDNEGELIDCYAFDNREEEAAQIYRYLLRNKPQKPMDTCIIARSNKYIAELSKYFQAMEVERGEKDGLRFFTVEENFQFFKKPVVKDILAVLKLLIYPFNRASMERLTEKFVRQVGVKSIENLRSYQSIGVSITSFIDGQTYDFGDTFHHLIQAFERDNIVVYDTETTGLDLEKDEIVQLSAIKIGKNGKILDTLDVLIQPTVPISEAAQKTHGFNLEYILSHGGITAKEGLEKFSAFVQGCVLVGHNNLAYDRTLVLRQLKENGLSALDIVEEYDTLMLSKQFYPQFDNYKLSTLCEHFSVVNECAHNALGDITATGKCLVKIIEENILPTTKARMDVLAKYAPKFEKFYVFFQELRSRFDNGEEIVEYIIDKLLLPRKYPSRIDILAMRDVALSLEKEKENRPHFLKEYLKDAALSGSQLDALVQKSNRIPIVTVHQAKGCEFDTVILAGADDRNFPSFAAKESGNEEEEKKIFYVAITRAKRKLILTRARYSGKYLVEETPYFWKIPEEYVRMNRAWKNGD